MSSDGSNESKDGANYYKGENGVNVNRLKAVQCWEDAWRKGNKLHSLALAQMLQNGDEDVSKNVHRAIEIHEDRLLISNYHKVRLGRLYLFGDETVRGLKDVARAKSLFEQVTESENQYQKSHALCDLAYIERHGCGVAPQSSDQIRKFCDLQHDLRFGSNTFFARGYFIYLKQCAGESFSNDPEAQNLINTANGRLSTYFKSQFWHLLTNAENNLHELDTTNQSVWTVSVFEKISNYQYAGYNFSCGVLLEIGGEFVPKNTLASYIFFRKAASVGHLDAIAKLQQLASSIGTTSVSSIYRSTSSSSVKPGLSKLQSAFAYALSKPDAITTEFLLHCINENNINCAADLIAGHNLVLLSIRTGLLNKEIINNFQGSCWFFKDHLYYPSTKLTNENPHILDAVYHHAQQVGIIKDGYPLKISRNLRADFTSTLMEVTSIYKSMATHVINIEKRVNQLEEHVATVDADITAIFDSMQVLAESQVNMKTAINDLTSSLSDLKELIRKKNKRDLYAGVAKVALSLVPFIGCALGPAIGVAADIMDGITGLEVLQMGASAGKCGVSKIAEVDLSNFQVIRATFSDEGLNRMHKKSKNMVIEAINKSVFGDLSTLQLKLSQEFESSKRENMQAFLLDNGECPWKYLDKEDTPQTTTSEDERLKDIARSNFNFVSTKRNSKTIPEELACEEINKLQVEENLDVVSRKEFEDMIEEISDDISVNEEIFVQLFIKIRSKSKKGKFLQMVQAKCSDFYEEHTYGPTKSINRSAKAAHKFIRTLFEFEEMESEKLRTYDVKALKELMTKYQVDNSGEVNKEGFVECVMAIVREHL